MHGGAAIVGVPVALACVLGGCSTGAPTDSHVSTAVLTHFRGVPRGVEVPQQAAAAKSPKPFAAWAAPGRVYVITWSSSSCPDIPAFVIPLRHDYVEIKTVAHDFHPGDNGCSADLGPTTSVVALPNDIDEHHPVTIWIDGMATNLPARS